MSPYIEVPCSTVAQCYRIICETLHIVVAHRTANVSQHFIWPFAVLFNETCICGPIIRPDSTEIDALCSLSPNFSYHRTSISLPYECLTEEIIFASLVLPTLTSACVRILLPFLLPMSLETSSLSRPSFILSRSCTGLLAARVRWQCSCL